MHRTQSVSKERYAGTTNLFKVTELSMSSQSLQVVKSIDVIQGISMIGLRHGSGFAALGSQKRVIIIVCSI